jgi:hypothetical protein
MNSKRGKESRSCDDIAFLSEIIVNFIFWQTNIENPANLGANLEHIFNFAEVKRI